MASAIKGASIIALPRKSQSFKTGRICGHPDCVTRISMYNRSSFCWLHANVKIPRLRGRKPKK